MPIFLFTGLSGAGKTTLAEAVKRTLSYIQLSVKIIDGDSYRKTICKDLGFSKQDRIENLRRLGEDAIKNETLYDVVIISAISPYEEARKLLQTQAKTTIIWIKCSLDVLTERDTKGLYKRALLPNNHPDKVTNLTGVNDTFEVPNTANMIIDTSNTTIEKSTTIICQYLLFTLKQSHSKTLHSKMPTLHLQQ